MEIQLTSNTILENTEVKSFKRLIWANRIALFIVFYWFGFLKLLAASPAEPLVARLHSMTIAPFIGLENFMIVLGIAECFIGLFWLIPKFTNWAFVIFSLQMFTTFLPLIMCPAETWEHMMVLTMTGQYIIKNVVLIACACTIFFTFSSKESSKK